MKMLRLAATTLVTFCFLQLIARPGHEDSLKQHPPVSSLDTNKVILLNQLAVILRDKDANLALNYATQARTLSERAHYLRGESHALENASAIYLKKGMLSFAFETSAKALKISDSLHNTPLVARLLNTLATVNLKQNQYSLAMENLRRACTVSRKISDLPILGQSLNNLGKAFLIQNQLDSAFRFVQEGIEVSKDLKNLTAKNLLGEAYQIAADIFLRKGEIAKALANYQLCLIQANASNDAFLKMTTLSRLGTLYNLKKEPALAVPYFLESIKLARYGYGEELGEAYKSLAESYTLLGDLSKAYDCQRSFVELHDSIHQQENSEQLALMQAKFNTELKQTQIDLLVKDAQIKQQEIDAQKIWLYFNIGCLALLLILALILYAGYRKIKNANHLLKAKNNAIRQQARELNHLNSTKDKLFSIISHDLRSPVASLKGLMSLLGSKVLSQEEFTIVVGKLKEQLDSVFDDLDNLLHWAQSQLKGLQALPQVFDLKLLVDTKIELFCKTAQNKKVSLINDVSEGSYVLADQNHISLVMRNLITNAIKFTSDGGLVRIQCNKNDDKFEISVSDSGVGMTMEDVAKLFHVNTHFTKRGTNEEKGAGIGLLLTKEFVEGNGGSISVNSELGRGTTFTFTVNRAIANHYVANKKCDEVMAD